jgi:hypothetical protein
LNFVVERRSQRACRLVSFPSRLAAINVFGTTVKAQRNPVNPPFFEKLRNSIAHWRAPGIS